jgi:predicted N-formylglutamate amidohydrolase
LPASELARHIAWDIGAAGVTEALSEIFDAPAILCNTSRLVIDCNRHLDASDLIPALSAGTMIPGNLHLAARGRSQSFSDGETTRYLNCAERHEIVGVG